MTTRGTGAIECNFCVSGYFWNNHHWEDHQDQCVDCCERCKDSCEGDVDNDCLDCGADPEDPGSDLRSLYVNRGWYRATSLSTRIYKCRLDGACQAGNSTSQQCDEGYRGALCGACSNGYDYDVVSNRCVACSTVSDFLARAGTVSIFLLIFAIIALVTWWSRRHHLVRSTLHISAEVLAVDVRRFFGVVEDRRHAKFRRRFLTKLKIIVAAQQIASSVDYVLVRVHFPKLFAVVSRLGRVTLAIVPTCLFPWTYMEKLLVLTLAPFLLVPFFAGLYWTLATRRRCDDHRQVQLRLIYGSLLCIYVILPTISTVVMTYFSCESFDRGPKRRHLRVIATQLAVPKSNLKPT